MDTKTSVILLIVVALILSAQSMFLMLEVSSLHRESSSYQRAFQNQQIVNTQFDAALKECKGKHK